MLLTLALTLGIYAVMALWGTPRLIAEAGGLMPFDLRPMGYGVDEARTYLAALSPGGRAFYLDVIGRLDTLFPPLLALSFVLVFLRLAPRPWALMLGTIAVAGAVLDLLENGATAALLRADPALVGDAAIAVASRWTVLKWAAIGICLVALLVLLGRDVWRRVGARF